MCFYISLTYHTVAVAMEDILTNFSRTVAIVVIAMLIVLVAMVVDLASGINKAKQRGEYRTSGGLKRTVSKFIMYEGGMLIAAGVDVLIHLSRLIDLFGLTAIKGIPVITCLVGVFLCVIEWISVREKADDKTRKKFTDTEVLVLSALKNEDVKNALMSIINKKNG